MVPLPVSESSCPVIFSAAGSSVVSALNVYPPSIEVLAERRSGSLRIKQAVTDRGIRTDQYSLIRRGQISRGKPRTQSRERDPPIRAGVCDIGSRGGVVRSDRPAVVLVVAEIRVAASAGSHAGQEGPPERVALLPSKPLPVATLIPFNAVASNAVEGCCRNISPPRRGCVASVGSTAIRKMIRW